MAQVAALVLFACGSAVAESPPAREQLLALSLDELMGVGVSTASIQPASWRAQPGVVTVISAEDMAVAGARTLQDVLQLVPGVSYGIDVFNVPGVVFRGTWAYEGKILFLVDDIPVNDLLFGIYAIPPNFPVEILERVEVLRGPGGAKYGENAELAVIRIYTRNTAQREGFVAVTTAAQRDGSPLRQASAGQQWRSQGNELAMLGTVSAGNWGSGYWEDATGLPINTSDQDITGAQFAVDAEWHGNHLQLYIEHFSLDAVQRYGFAAADQEMTFEHANLRLERELKLSPSTTLTPRWTYRSENTWHGESVSLPGFYELPAWRHTLELEARHGMANGVQLRAGVQEYWAEVHAEQMNVPSAFPGKTPANYFGGQSSTDYDSFSAYAEAEIPWSGYLLGVGGRFTHHSESGSAAVPRLALTRAETDWHVKALAGSAYREPQFEITNQRATGLKPEQTTAYEIEGGHRLGEHQYLTASLFRYRLRDALVFGVAPSGIPGYVNAPSFHGEGLELQWQLRYDRVQAQANYQRSRTDDDAIALYDVQGRSGQSLGAPRDVFNLWLGWQLDERWSLHPRLRYEGERTAYVRDPASSASPPLEQARLDEEIGGDLAARYRSWPWTVDAGVRNVTDEERLLPQPYAGVSPPYPVGGREAWLRLEYEF
jgi:outer membrane receptor protein involved in Fe transport